MKDFFVSYNSADRIWAEWIAWQLEEAGYTTVIQAWDFRPGSNFVLEMQRAATEAERTIAVLSPHYLGARFTQPEWAAAFRQDPTGEKGTLLPVRVQECDLEGLLPQIIYIDLVGLEETAACDTLLAGVRHERAKPTTAPAFPGARRHTVAKPERYPGEAAEGIKPAHLFICYKRNVDPDQKLANYLHEFLAAKGHDVFIDGTLRTGEAWLEEIDRQIKASDFLVVLLSKESADSEMVQAEVRRAYEYRKLQGHPRTLPVRMAYEGLLPYSIDAFLDPFQYVVWRSEADNERVAQDILAAIEDRLPKQAPIQARPVAEGLIISEDGRPVADNETVQPPLPEFDPRILKKLTVPGGAVKLCDELYIKREADERLKDQVDQMVEWGTTTTIRAPRQTGKTSLLMRGIHYAREQGVNVVALDFQGFSSNQLSSLDVFLRELADSICDELDLDEDAVEQSWRGSQSAPRKLRRFIEKHVLSVFDEPIVLAMDEADRLLQTGFYKDFFGLIRFWHNRRASHKVWEKLNFVLVISTEPYLLIDDIHQSPFNVGLNLDLADFDEAQVRDLNRRHGSPVARSNLSHLMELLHGHPFLTRRALYTMVTEHITWSELARNAHTDHGPFSDHLKHQYWTIYDKPELKKALKEIVDTGLCSDEVALLRLLRAGLVRGSGDVCTCRCELYRLYFKDKLF